MSRTDQKVRLRPLTRIEFPEWVAASRAGYALGIELHGGHTREEAQRKADADTAAALPAGFDTPGQAMYVIEAAGTPVGRLWLGEREINGRRALFVYDIAIDEPFRGRGFGRAAMRHAEEEARGRGFRRLELHVFGGNGVARELYRSLGYVETSVRMAKDLDVP
jgi:ribosomal protein S18 acetylase RimI-like enzyme